MGNLGDSIGNALVAAKPVRIDDVPRFRGGGVYALYYTGDVPLYSLISESNQHDRFHTPIYVGKAVPPGTRKGQSAGDGAKSKSATSSPLRSRLGEHLKSLAAAENLAIEDFFVRWLVTEQIWIPLGERLLINRFAPVWNTVVDGFGNHDPGRGRHAGMVTRWDVLHPGRPWAHKFAPRNEDLGDIERDVAEYVRQRIQV